MTTKAETDVLVGLALDEMDARTIGLSGEALKLELEKFIGGIGRINGILFSNWKFGLPPPRKNEA